MVKNEHHGTLFQPGTWQNLTIDTLRINKNQVAKKNPPYARGPIFPSKLCVSPTSINCVF